MRQHRGILTQRRRGISLALVLAALVVAPPADALDIGRSGIALNVPDRGWKFEVHEDAAIKVWHLRAETWDPTPDASRLIALTLSHLDGDPWPDPAALRDAAAKVVAGEIMTGVTRATPYEASAGRFQVAGMDFDGALPMGQANSLPASARLLVIRTGDGGVILTAFSLEPVAATAFANGVFGPDDTTLLTARGPGAQLLNGIPAKLPQPGAAPNAAAPDTEGPDAEGPGVEDLLEQMRGGFAPAGTETGQ